MAGQIDRNRGEVVASNSETSYTDTDETGGDINGGEEVHLRDGGQRTDSAYSGGTVSAVEESAGRDQSRNPKIIGADRETAALTYGEKRVSPAELGIKGGSKKKTIRIVTGGDTAATREAKRIAKQRGLELVLFKGDNLRVKERGVDVSARAYIVGNKAYVRVDHPKFNSAQLMGHEEGHNKIARGEIDPNAVRKRIEKAMGKGKVRAASRMYVDAYEGSGLTAEEIWEEVICDANGNMNIFTETMNEAQAGEYLEQVRSAVDAEADKGRAPPAADTNDSGKMSRENGRRAKRGRSIEIETMENNRFERLRQFKGDLPAQWYAYTRGCFYVYSNHSYMDYTILDKVRITQKNIAVIDQFTEELENGTYKPAETFDCWTSDFRRGKGRYNWDSVRSGNRGSAMQHDGMDGGKRRGNDRGNSGENGGNQEEE